MIPLTQQLLKMAAKAQTHVALLLASEHMLKQGALIKHHNKEITRLTSLRVRPMTSLRLIP